MGIKIKVLYEDNYVIVFDKPSGTLVIPAPGHDNNATLTHVVNKQYASVQGYRLHPCHRLDKETSGVIIYAKGKKNQKMMRDIFHERGVKKKYIAFVKGHIKKKKGQVKSFIVAHPKAKLGKRRKMAMTAYKVIREFRGFSMVEASPHTGRTHQIRIHFRQLGHPLLGERIYAYRKDFQVDFKRLALHAQAIAFKHPVMKKNISVRSQLPKDMVGFLKGFGYSTSR